MIKDKEDLFENMKHIKLNNINFIAYLFDRLHISYCVNMMSGENIIGMDFYIKRIEYFMVTDRKYLYIYDNNKEILKINIQNLSLYVVEITIYQFIGSLKE